MATINQHSSRNSAHPSAEGPPVYEDGWGVQYGIMSIRYTTEASGLLVTVTDYDEHLDWRVLGQLSDVPVMASGDVRREWKAPRGDGLMMAKAAACSAADRLSAKGVEPRLR